MWERCVIFNLADKPDGVDYEENETVMGYADMKKDHGICIHKGIQRPFVGFKELKNGMFEVWLTRGRGKDGVPVRGRKLKVYFWEIVRMEGE